MIPAEAIADIKAQHEIVAFIESCGVELKRHGKSYLGLCPLHPDTRPSLSVDAVKQRWCCLGACSSGGKITGGDVIEFARRYWGVSFREALTRLGASTSAALPSPVRPLAAVRPIAFHRRGPSGAGRGPAGLLSRVVAVYHQSFLLSEKARDYAAARGLTRADVLAALPIGYADGTLLETAPDGSETWEALRTLGVVTASGRELLAGCLVVPLRDLTGDVVSLYGRAIDRDQHLYLPGPRCGLVNAACAGTTDELILTESVLDALSFLEAGIPNAIPLYGTNGWTPDHDALLEKHRIRRVLLALDGDEAGRRASVALATKLRARGIEVLDVGIA
jgi:DNA primase catalytic core